MIHISRAQCRCRIWLDCIGQRNKRVRDRRVQAVMVLSLSLSLPLSSLFSTRIQGHENVQTKTLTFNCTTNNFLAYENFSPHRLHSLMYGNTCSFRRIKVRAINGGRYQSRVRPIVQRTLLRLYRTCSTAGSALGDDHSTLANHRQPGVTKVPLLGLTVPYQQRVQKLSC